MSWTKVLPVADLAEGERRVVNVEGRTLLLIHHQGEVYAVASTCSHMRLPLQRGKISEDGALVCPWHRSAFDLASGDVKTWSPWPPGAGRLLGAVSREKALPTYPTRVEDGSIWVDLGGGA